MNGGSLKKRLCNPPAELVAGCGDPEVQGMFIGAGQGVELVEDETKRHDFVDKVTKIEASYVKARKDLAARVVSEMDAAFHMLI